MKKILAIIILLLAVIAISKLSVFNKAEAPSKPLSYHNETYGYELSYPSSLSVKEYTPEITTIGTISGTGENEAVQGVAEAQVMEIEVMPSMSFEQNSEKSLEKFCDADGPTSSISCTGTKSSETFTTTSGITGYKAYLQGEIKTLATGEKTPLSKGPFYIFKIYSRATSTEALVIHSPLNQTAEEADATVIEMIAKSLILNSSIQSPARFMDIESYIRTNISTLSPTKEVLGGTYYVTEIEAHGGAGTVSYEDGHIAHTADFIYSVSENGMPEVTSFTVRK